jgi:hypothetical protein
VGDDVVVFSYLAPDSGYTLTSVLDYASNTVVAFASNERCWRSSTGRSRKSTAGGRVDLVR